MLIPLLYISLIINKSHLLIINHGSSQTYGFILDGEFYSGYIGDFNISFNSFMRVTKPNVADCLLLKTKKKEYLTDRQIFDMVATAVR
ncbi:hypothetical protein AS030_06555 [Fictibacillus enclensis]|uniref:Uncharacterized protein n=1 Tax=Fictibacillus enclensis TaxID=1017270 RepID=A0A0V8JDS4_9BACL|nr:hypothetical protein AS030_06555 [Fictibacillus enclensis]